MNFFDMDTPNFFKTPKRSLYAFIFVFTLICFQLPAHGQVKQPEVRSADNPKTPLGQGFDNRFGGGIMVNNFGFGIGGTYSHAIGPYSEFTFSIGITGIRDASEQSFQNFFTGNNVVPNKFNRVLGFPVMFGLKKRIFPRQVADNFRFFVAASAGPALGLVYPYFEDDNNSGFRDFIIDPRGFRRPIEDRNSFFGGLGDASSQLGGAGEIKIGVDLGSNFKRQSTLEIGYFFYYFNEGLQLGEPNRPFGFQPCPGNQAFGCPVAVNSQGERRSFLDPQKFFGTPQIRFTFSGWW